MLRVLDGDTFDVRLSSGADRRVRLLDVDSPATSRCGGVGAQRSLRRLLPGGSRVTLVTDPAQQRQDSRNRLLRYVVRNGTDVNRVQLGRGWAVVTYDNDRPFRRFNSFVSAQHDADLQNRGIWGFCRTVER